MVALIIPIIASQFDVSTSCNVKINEIKIVLFVYIYLLFNFFSQQSQQSVEQGPKVTEIRDVRHTFSVHVTKEDVIDARVA